MAKTTKVKSHNTNQPPVAKKTAKKSKKNKEENKPKKPPVPTAVRKFRIAGGLSTEDETLALDALSKLHSFKNRSIQAELVMRDEMRAYTATLPGMKTLDRKIDKAEQKEQGIADALKAQYKPKLDKLGAQLSKAAKAGTKTTQLANERKTLTTQMKRDIAQQTAESKAQLKVLYEERKALIDKHSDPEKTGVIYLKMQQTIKDAKVAIDDPDLAKATWNSGPFEEGHCYSEHWHQKNHKRGISARIKQRAYKAKGDPEFRVRPRSYLNTDVEKGTLCSGINQCGPRREGRRWTIVDYNNPKAGLICFKSVPNPDAYNSEVQRSERKKLMRGHDVLFRLGTVKGTRRPEWITLKSVIFHQEVPVNAPILDALLKTEMIGTNRHWYLILSLDMTDYQITQSPKSRSKSAAYVKYASPKYLDNGMLRFGELEVNSKSTILSFNTDPRQKKRKHRTQKQLRSEILTSKQMVSDGYVKNRRATVTHVARDEDGDLIRYSNGKPESERSRHLVHTAVLHHETQKSLFNTQIPIVLDYLKKTHMKKLPPALLEEADPTTPEHLRGVNMQRKPLYKVKSNRTFQRLYREWRECRVPGDEEAFEALQYWAYKDVHYHNWIRSSHARMQRRRADVFKKLAHELCTNYGTIYLDDTDLTQLSVYGETKDIEAAVRRLRAFAAFGEFREILKKTAKRMGVVVIPSSMTDITQMNAA